MAFNGINTNTQKGGTKDSLRDLWDNIKLNNIWIIGVPEKEEKKGYEKIYKEIMVENFPNRKKK